MIQKKPALGALRERIEILKYDRTVSATGAVRNSPAVIVTVAAEVKELSGVETIRAGQPIGTITYRIRTAWLGYALNETTRDGLEGDPQIVGAFTHAQATDLSSAATATAPAASNDAILSASGEAVRFTLDGTTPTATLGFRLNPMFGATLIPFEPSGTLSAIEEAASAVLDYGFSGRTIAADPARLEPRHGIRYRKRDLDIVSARQVGHLPPRVEIIAVERSTSEVARYG